MATTRGRAAGAARTLMTILSRATVALVFVALWHAVAEAQQPEAGRIVGRVLVAATGEAAEGAIVTIVGGAATARAGAEGHFELASVPAGRQRLLARQGDLVSRPVDVEVVAGRSLEVTLTIGFEERVVVTATRTRKGLDSVPVRTEVIGKDMIDTIAARTLADAVEYTNGVRVENNCQNCNFSQIRLLGLEGPYTQILVDNQPVVSSLAQVYGIEQIPTRMIERIEVVKGGGSALYGPGSVGGVVNIIPREPRRNGFFMETGVGMREDLPSFASSVSGDWVAGDRNTFLTAFGQFDRVHPFDVNGDGFTEVAKRDLDAAGARFNRFLHDGEAKLTVDFNHLREERRGGDRLDLPPEQALIAEAISSRRYAATVGWLHRVDAGFDYTLTASFADTSRDSYYGTFMDPNAFGETENDLWVADSLFNHYVGHHALSWGGQYSRDRLADSQPAYGRHLDETYTNAGLFFQDDWALASGWELLLGVRADKHSELGSLIASPRAVMMYSPGPSLNVRASLATGFRAPQAFDEDLHLSSVGGAVQIIHLDPDLVEERSLSAMAGVEWRPTLGPGQGLFEINGFATRLTDLFHVQEADDPATPEAELLKTNFGGADVYGVELNGGWGIGDDLVFQGGIVLQRSRFDEPEPDFGSADFFRTPNRYGNLSATWERHGLARFFLGMRYTGAMMIPHYAGYIAEDRLETTEPFYVLDLLVSKPFEWSGRRLELLLGLRNLTDAYQAALDEGPLRDSTYVYGPRFPRSLRAGLRLDL